MSERALEVLKRKFGDSVYKTHSQHGDDTAIVDPARWKDICLFLRDDPQTAFDMCVDLCAVDYPGRVPRVEVVLHLYSVSRRHRLRLKAAIGDEDLDECEIDSVTDLWPGANWLERETFDMMGVKFRGHPDLRRILLYPEFVGHPLRKDYDASRTQPLVPYRTEADAGVPVDKLVPFGPDEGMPFGRLTVRSDAPATHHED